MGMMKRVAQVVFLVAMAVCAVALGRTFHRSFRNGYPAEWNVSKEEAELARPLSQRSVRLGGPTEPAVQREIVGIVSRVLDGDTIWVTDAQKVRHKIRLYGIEAPKAKAAFGGESAARLQALVGGKLVRVTYAARDSEFDGHSIKAGEYLALLDGALLGSYTELDTLYAELGEACARFRPEFVTVYFGADVTAEDAEDASAALSSALPEAEVSVVNGGQPVYYFMISLE